MGAALLCALLAAGSGAVGCSSNARNLDEPEKPKDKRDSDGGSKEKVDRDAAVPDAASGGTGGDGPGGDPERDAGKDTGDDSFRPPAHEGPTYPGVIPEPADRAAFLFDQESLRTYELLIAPEDLARIDADPRAEEYVPGMLRFQGVEYGPVGVRYKGSIGAFRNCLTGLNSGAKACTKLSMKVAFDWQDSEGRFYGLRKLQFHAMNRDPSMLRERLGYAMFREFGLAAPRAVHARLRINGTLNGLYMLVEQIDGRFTRSRFAEGGRGNLYKEAWPMDANNHAIEEAALFEKLETNEDEMPSLETMLGFARAIEEASLSSLPDAMSAYTDLDYTLSYVAVDRTIAHDDGPFHWYCSGTCYNHNYYWYEATNDARLWLIAWDLDNSFSLNNTTTTVWMPWDDTSRGCQPMTQLPYLIPLRPPACDKLTLGWATLQKLYLERVQAFLDEVFTPENVEGKLRAWERQIAPTIAEAAMLHADAPTMAEWNEGRAVLRATLSTLLQRARDRIEQGPIEVQNPWGPEPPDPDMDGGT